MFTAAFNALCQLKSRNMKRAFSIFCLSFYLFAEAAAQSSWLHDFEFGLSVAQKSGRLALVDFWATWCGPCKAMDREVWDTPEAAAFSQHFVPIKIDVDQERGLATTYGVQAIPLVLIMDYTGKVLYSERGYSGRQILLKILESIPADVSEYYSKLALIEKESPPEQLRDVGLALQMISGRTNSGQLRNSLLNQGDVYLKKARKSAETDEFETEIALWLILSDVHRNRASKVVKEIAEISAKGLTPRNEAISYWVLSEAYRSLKDDENHTKYARLLSEHPSAAELPRTNP